MIVVSSGSSYLSSIEVSSSNAYDQYQNRDPENLSNKSLRLCEALQNYQIENFQRMTLDK